MSSCMILKVVVNNGREAKREVSSDLQDCPTHAAKFSLQQIERHYIYDTLASNY